MFCGTKEITQTQFPYLLVVRLSLEKLHEFTICMCVLIRKKIGRFWLHFISFDMLIAQVSNITQRCMIRIAHQWWKAKRRWLQCNIPLLICTLISSSRNWLLNLIFCLHISNLIFTAFVACKNPVWNRHKIKFKNQVCKLEISKNKCRSTRGMWDKWPLRDGLLGLGLGGNNFFILM